MCFILIDHFFSFLMNTETTKIIVIKVFLLTFIVDTGLTYHMHIRVSVQDI